MDFLRPKSLAKRPDEVLVAALAAVVGSEALLGTLAWLATTTGGAGLLETTVDSVAGVADAICCTIFSEREAVESLEPLRRRRLGLRKIELPMLDRSR